MPETSETIEKWFAAHFHGQPAMRDTETFNHVRRAVDDLKQIVDRRVDDAVRILGRSHVLPSSLIAVNQRYHLPAHFIDRCVDQCHVELVGRGELFLGHGQAPFDDFGQLGAAAGEPADELRP